MTIINIRLTTMSYILYIITAREHSLLCSAL